MARAEKEATVFCVDVGAGMQDAPASETSSLDMACRIVTMFIQRKIFAELRDEVALVLFGTDETSNSLFNNDDGSYSNISVIFPLCIPSWDLLDYITNTKFHNCTASVDFLDALTVSLDLLYKQSREKKFLTRRIALLTNFSHLTNDDNLDGIINGFKVDNMDVELNVISPSTLNVSKESWYSDGRGDGTVENEPNTSISHDRPSSSEQNGSFLQKPKNNQQVHGENIVKRILSSGIEGTSYSFQQVIQSVCKFEKRFVNSAAWKCNLCLGNELVIPCVAYAKTKEAKMKKSWKKCHARTGKTEDITRNSFYFVDDDQRTEVTKEKLVKGYKYGKDIIPFNADDEKQMTYRTDGKQLLMLGFTDIKHVPVQYHFDDQAHFVLPEPGDQNSASSVSALVAGMNNQHLCAIASYVYRKGSNPKLVALIPHVKMNYQIFIMVSLPFSEDLRNFNFMSLQKTSELVDQQKLSCLEKYIGVMDLDTKERNEMLIPQNKLNPYFQKTLGSFLQKNLNQSLAESISEDNSATNLNESYVAKQLADFFALKRVNSDETPKKWWGNKEKYGAAVSSSQETVVQITGIGTVSPSNDFLCILKQSSSTQDIVNAFQSLQAKIEELTQDPFALQLSDKIISCLNVLIEEARKRSYVQQTNAFLKKLKEILLASNQTLWKKLIEHNISFIDCSELGGALKSEIQLYESPKNASPTDEENADDLLNLL